jgi:hypothetical protein
MLALVGIAASAVTLLVQQALFVPDIDQLHDTYLGTPAFAHLDWALMRHRLHRLAQNRSYIYLPCFLTLTIAARQRRWALAIGPLAGVPWIAMTLVARSPQAGELMSYYGFPLMIGLCWPMLAARLEAGPDQPRVALRLLAANVMLSIVLFTVSGGMHDGRPWENFGPPDTARIAATEAALDEILSHRHEIGPFVVDDAVGALRPSGFRRSELRLLMGFTAAEITALNAMVFYPTAWLSARKEEIIAAAGLSTHYRLRGTRLLLYSRSRLNGLNMLEPVEEPR